MKFNTCNYKKILYWCSILVSMKKEIKTNFRKQCRFWFPFSLAWALTLGHKWTGIQSGGRELILAPPKLFLALSSMQNY